MSHPADEPGFSAASYPFEPFVDASFVVPPPRRKFQNRLWLHVLLFLLTLASTTYVGAFDYAAFLSEFVRHPVESSGMSFYLHGLWYSGTLLAILGAHEMGHYLYCRHYDVDATLPYFLPMPFFLTGTMGAVIKIREAFPTRRVVFDIAVAGPIAGFVVLVPALFYGMALSNVVPEPTQGTYLFLGEPLLFKLATRTVFGAVAGGYTVNIHPMVFGAWFGMLATALNLLPFGQLDGGHITYSTLGRWSTPISIATVSFSVIMTAFFSISWLVMTLMMLVMLFTLGPRHPRVLNEYESLGSGRNLVALAALVIFILCFTPVPIQIQDILGK